MKSMATGDHDKLTTSKGGDLPISGVFLLHDGTFIEMATMDTPTAKNSQAMAHAGPYVPTDQGVNLTAEQQISIATEGDEPPLSFMQNIGHVLRAENTGDHLVLTFSSGTEQTFTRIPASEITLYTFANGRLALTGDRFVLVAGDQSGVVSGYGRYRMSDDTITFMADRWAEATPAKPNIAVDKTVSATLDKAQLKLSDGRTFAIVN